MEEQILLTQEDFDRIEAERDHLVSVRRKEVSERLKEAISYGDLSENAEYDAAKNEQAELEEKISKLENMLRNAKIIKEDEVTGDTVNVGQLVEVKDEDNGMTLEFIITGSTADDPFAEPPRIANDAPVGRGLMGKKIGETAEITIPDGVLHYTVTKITKM